MTTNKTKRLLTISAGSQERQANTSFNYYIPVPQLRLAGKWFQKAGFQPGDIVEVETQDNCLIIRKTPNKWVKTQQVIREKFMVNEQGERIA